MCSPPRSFILQLKEVGGGKDFINIDFLRIFEDSRGVALMYPFFELPLKAEPLLYGYFVDTELVTAHYWTHAMDDDRIDAEQAPIA